MHGQLLQCKCAWLIWTAAVAQRAELLRAKQQEQRHKLSEEERRKVSPQTHHGTSCKPCGHMHTIQHMTI